jgi:hypothetical protein
MLLEIEEKKQEKSKLKNKKKKEGSIKKLENLEAIKNSSYRRYCC